MVQLMRRIVSINPVIIIPKLICPWSPYMTYRNFKFTPKNEINGYLLFAKVNETTQIHCYLT